jgi:cytoskeleton protein RodZ
MSEPARSFDAEPAPAVSGAGAAQATTQGPGALLGDERRRQGLSLGDIARQLKLSVRQIEALERDDYGAFSGMVFVRGFLRNYAKLLQLDADALIAQLPPSTAAPAAAAGTAAAPLAVPAPVAPETGPRQGRPGLGWLAGGLVLALLVVAAIYEGRRHESAGQLGRPTQQPLPGGALISPQHADSPPPGTAVSAAPALATPAVEMAQSGTAALPASAVTPAVAPAAVGALPGAAPAAPPIQPAVNQIPAAPPPADPGVPASPAGVPRTPAAAATAPATAGSAARSEAGQLRLKFQAEAWVEVKDASGTLLFSRLGSAGSEEVVQGRAPLQVVVGNAHAVQVTYQGRVVDLGPHTRVDVARLVLE